MKHEFSELPFDLPGDVYRSVMPYGSYDPGGEVYQAYIAAHISTVVVLVGEDEITRLAGRDLISLYQGQGWQVIHLPIKDFGIPDHDSLAQAVESALTNAKDGENVAIHCSAGIGRTGTFAACMAKRAYDLDGEGAIGWLRRYLPGAVETEEQKKLVNEF